MFISGLSELLNIPIKISLNAYKSKREHRLSFTLLFCLILKILIYENKL
jgi:hypothetical protein